MSVYHTVGRSASWGEELCNDCQSLGLSRDKFIIATSDLARTIGLRPTTARARVVGTVPPSRSQLNSGFGKRSLGKLSKVRTNAVRKGCPFCTLVWSAVKRYSLEIAEYLETDVASGTSVDCESNVSTLDNGADNASELERSFKEGKKPDDVLDPTCFMVWEVDGRQALDPRPGSSTGEEDDTHYHNVSRRIRFWWKQRDGRDQESYILFVPPPDPMVPNADGFQQGRWAKSEFLARDFDPKKSQYALIGSWLDLCDRHKPRCTELYEPERFEELQKQNWFGVINVIQMNLCRLPRTLEGSWERYVALSYVWGKDPHPDHCTRRANVIKRTYPGNIDERNLPETIRQAIQLTRDLGLRYIWIDSMCIVQDSYSSFKLNAEQMDLIYGNAHLTICAADGNSAREGLTAFNPMKADKPIANDVDGLRLQVSRPSERVIQDSVWDQRGWTFQERILSPRCLVFAGGRFYFQCRKSNMSQDIYPDPTGNGLSMDWMNSPLRTLRGLETRPISLYMKFVSLYTGRHLTNAEDILPAFEGVAGLMRSHMHGDRAKFLYGLPPSHFDLALLWEPLSAQKRREPSKNVRSGQIDMELPSWSWAGWTDASFDMNDSPAEEKSREASNDKGSRVRYKGETLDGCFVDVHEWLLQHTWIQWFIRDSSGDLRPVWDKRLMREVKDVLPRWRGYAVDEDVRAVQILNRSASQSYQDDRYHDPPPIEYPPNPKDEDAHNQGGGYPQNRGCEYLPNGNRGYPQNRGCEYLPNPNNYEKRPEVELRLAREREASLVRQIREDARERQSDHGQGSSEYGTVLPVTPRITLTEGRITDSYGRNVQGMVRKDQPEFSHSVCDTPFGVRVVSLEAERSHLPDQAILQFFTLRAQFYILLNEDATEASHPGSGLVRCDIADENNDWCGHIVLNEDIAKKRDGAKCHFIALSEAKSFTQEECRNWAHYIPRDQEDVEWDLYFVLLIEYNQTRLLWERVSLGKVFQVAFQVGGSEKPEEILLG